MRARHAARTLRRHALALRMRLLARRAALHAQDIAVYRQAVVEAARRCAVLEARLGALRLRAARERCA
ncbi:MAG: hypothetical protein ACREVL_09225 [Solimonas sp.]